MLAPTLIVNLTISQYKNDIPVILVTYPGQKLQTVWGTNRQHRAQG
jgi:hypothetical protein